MHLIQVEYLCMLVGRVFCSRPNHLLEGHNIQVVVVNVDSAILSIRGMLGIDLLDYRQKSFQYQLKKSY